jgi:hypothetical protein
VSLEYRSWNKALPVVEVNAPEGFRDLPPAFTLFADSARKTNPEQRGRFNFFEKSWFWPYSTKSPSERQKGAFVLTVTVGTISSQHNQPEARRMPDSDDRWRMQGCGGAG